MFLATSRSSAVTFIIVFNGYLSRFFFPLHAASLHRASHFLTEGFRLDSGTWNQLLSRCGILRIEILSISYVILLRRTTKHPKITMHTLVRIYIRIRPLRRIEVVRIRVHCNESLGNTNCESDKKLVG